MMSFMLVFTVLRTAANSDFVYSSMVSTWLLSCSSSLGWSEQRTLFPSFRRWHALQWVWMSSWAALSPHYDRCGLCQSDKIFQSSREPRRTPSRTRGRPLRLFGLFGLLTTPSTTTAVGEVSRLNVKVVQ